MLSFNTRFLPGSERRSTTLSYTGTLPRILHFHTPKQLGNPSDKTYSLFRPTCSLFLCSIFLRFFTFFLLKLHFARFLYFVHFIRLPLNNCLLPCICLSIYLFGSLLLYVRWPCLSFSTIVSYRKYRTKIIKILPTWTSPNRLRGIRIKQFNVTPQNFIVSPHLSCFLLSSIHSFAQFFNILHQVFHSPDPLVRMVSSTRSDSQNHCLRGLRFFIITVYCD